MTNRLSQINTWLSSLLPDLHRVEAIQADASSRNYYRAYAGPSTYIVMDTEPGEELLNFIQIANRLQGCVTVPTIIQQDLAHGLLLLTDFGTETYLKALEVADSNRVDQLYMDALIAMHKLQTVTAPLPNMDSEYISQRLNVFTTWYLQRHLQIAMDATLLQDLHELFTNCFQTQKQVFVHVDYHCRNLMVLADGNPGIIDFQDAMLGPITYDLVSLFQDAYITWPRPQVEAWVSSFAKLVGLQDGPQLLREFDLVGLQRHLKNLGVFARLHHRDGKSHYLPHIPTLLNYITSTCENYPELAKLHEFMRSNVLEFIVAEED